MTSTGSLGGGSRKEETVADNDNDAAVKDALETLRQAMIDRGDDPGSVDAALFAAQPKTVTYAGNFADLNRMGQIAVQGEIETPPGEENIQTSDIQAAFENPQPTPGPTDDQTGSGSVAPEDANAPDPNAVAAEGNGANYDSMTKAELQAELDSRGVSYSSDDTKAELISKLGG